MIKETVNFDIRVQNQATDNKFSTRPTRLVIKPSQNNTLFIMTIKWHSIEN